MPPIDLRPMTGKDVESLMGMYVCLESITSSLTNNSRRTVLGEVWELSIAYRGRTLLLCFNPEERFMI